MELELRDSEVITETEKILTRVPGPQVLRAALPSCGDL